MRPQSSVLVCGLGLTGLSLARHWLGRGARVRVMDTRASPPSLAALRAELPGCEFEAGPVEGMVEAGAKSDVVALSPGIPASPFAGLDCPVVGDVECFFSALAEADAARSPAVIAVTGTNGKSTLVSMVAHMLRCCGREGAAIGNIGLPLLDALAQWGDSGAPPEFAAAELSSFQLETAAAVPARVSAVLNVSEDHLDRHGSLQCYAEVKSKVYRGAQCAAVNRGDIFCAAMRHECPEEIGFAAREDNAKEGDWRVEEGGEPALSRGDGKRFALPAAKASPTLLANAVAAMAVTEPLGISPGTRAASFDSFVPLPHRMTPVGMVGSISFYDDSKATNIDAAIAAMSCFGDSRTVLIAGGDSKSQRFSRLAAASRGKVGHFVLIGADADEIASALDAESVPSSRADGMREAVALAYSLAPDSGRVILSPACSSLDMYADYAARGDDFASTVRNLSAGHVA